MSDLIRRQDAIDAIHDQISARLDWMSESLGERKGLDVVLAVILDLPTADITETEECKRCQESVERVLANAHPSESFT